jgi:acetolactate synthase-1/2/3 large subunit
LVALKQSIEKELYENLAPQMAYIKVLREGLPEEGILVEELTQVAYVSRFAFPVYRPRSFIGTGYQGTLGFGFATALGVKIGNPERPVLSITGDGGFMYNVQELATAVQQGIDIVTVVFNDGAFGNVQRMQIEDYGGKVIATNLHNPDFVALAQSFGAQGLRANSPEELAAALKEGFATPGPTLIDVPIGETPAPWGYLNLPKVRG